MDGFKFFAPAYLYKSEKNKKRVKVGGILTTEDRDSEGEIIKSIDWTYFTNGLGKIKYEHHEIKGPDAIIGYPVKLIKKGKETHFEGALVEFDPNIPEEKLTTRQRLAKSVVTLLDDMNAFNAEFPDIPQRAGWSIEGDYLSKDKNGVVKARITNVVFTTKPVNPKTFATLIKSQQFNKALTVGDGVSPETQTGWGALRLESIDSNPKNKQGENEMYGTKAAFYKSCKEKGMTDEEALKAANEWEEEQRKNKSSEFSAAEKSLSNSKTALEKSLKSFDDYNDIEIEIDLRDTKKALAKSLQTDNEGNVDITKMFEEAQNINLKTLEVLELTNKKFDILAKSVQTLTEAALNSVSGDSFMQKSIAIADEKISDLNKGLALLTTSIKKSGKTTLSAEAISKANFDDNNKTEEGEKELSKSQTLQVLDQLRADEKITTNDIAMFEATGSLNSNVKELVKSSASKILNL